VGINPDNLVQTYGNYEISSGYETTLETFRSRRPTALVCGNDRMAVGALLALHTLGLEVPGDVSVVGFDDQPDVADQLRPRLTTVKLPHYEMGRQAGQLLAETGVDAPTMVTVPCPLITRDSLGKPPVREL
jgi:LacI family transcriptional regulator